ncbi:hypothetical protein [Heyndrickxia acidicola]|uniref:Uncharacterized protein n=1 Tax=Heyndrickxia acidicola TaxID=209389 RepID=A0ABU6MJW0_9BACI|nr:hypothetical protein [Heyndrickxia acidicola]MED1204667.1 hypothetical protein [Heyndrickxia acidicola]
MDKKFWVSTFITLSMATIFLALCLLRFSLQTSAGTMIISSIAILLVSSNLIYFKIIKSSNLFNQYLEITNNISYFILSFIFYVATNNELLVFLFVIMGFGSALIYKKDAPKKTF